MSDWISQNLKSRFSAFDRFDRSFDRHGRWKIPFDRQQACFDRMLLVFDRKTNILTAFSHADAQK